MMWVNFEMVWWWWKHSQKEENEILMDVIMLRCILVFLLSLILLIDFEKAFVAISFISQFLVFFCERFNYSLVFIPYHFLIMKWLRHPVIPFQAFLAFLVVEVDGCGEWLITSTTSTSFDLCDGLFCGDFLVCLVLA